MAIKTPQQIAAEVEKKLGKGIKAASYFLQARVKECISIPAPRKIVLAGKGFKYYRATTRATPGAPPRKLSGRLRASIAVEFNNPQNTTIARIGTNVVYSAKLEEQNHKYLTLMLNRYRNEIRAIVVRTSKAVK
jgi:phage gpG-like protein